MASSPPPMRQAFHVSETFITMGALKEEIARYFGQRKIGFRLPTNDTSRLKAVCTEHKNCPFCLWARRIGGSDAVRITSFNDEHSATIVVTGIDRKRAPNRVRGVLLAPIATSVLSTADVGVKSTVIAKRARNARFEVNRRQAWRAKQAAINVSEGDGKDSYKYMRSWLLKVKEANPGSSVRFEQHQNHFARACIVHGVFNTLFPSMIQVVALDACHLKSRDKGVLYVASLITGNFDVVIAGMAISNVGKNENKDSWLFFLEALTEAMASIFHRPSLFVVSDRDKGLLPAVAEKITNCHHSFCSVHTQRNVLAKFHTGLDGAVHKIARATIEGEVNDLFAALRKSYPEPTAYLEAMDKTCWIMAHFLVPRFGIVTSNAAEAMNSSIAEERLAAHLAVFVRITRKMSTRLGALHATYSGIGEKELVPRIEKATRKAMDSALRRDVLPVNVTNGNQIFEVQRLSNQDYCVVDLVKKTCSCGVWQEMQYPCVHALAVVNHQRLDIADYVNPVFLKATCAAAVSGSITSVDVASCESDETALPPIVAPRRAAGKKKRIPSAGESEESKDQAADDNDDGFDAECEQESGQESTRKIVTCSVCGLTGHNKRTCASTVDKLLPNFEEDARDLTKWHFVEGIWYPENMFDLEFE